MEGTSESGTLKGVTRVFSRGTASADPPPPGSAEIDAGRDPAGGIVVASDPVACSIAASLEVIGDRWTMLILREAFRGTRRFDHFQRDLGLARNLLADRLNRLVEHGVFHKVPYQERPVRFEYRLTPKGVDLSPSLVALMRWGDRWVVGEAGPPVVLVHDACASPVDQEFICWECDCVVTPGQLRSRHPRAHEGDVHVHSQPA